MPSELKSRWPEVNRDMRRGVSTGLLRSGEQMKAKIVQEMNDPKSGRIYHQSYGTHQASAPGQSPASDYGLLEASIQINQETEMQVAVSTNVPYAPGLEFGTTKVASRPMWVPIAEGMAKESEQIVALEIQRAVK